MRARNDSLSSKPWKDVHFENGNINPFSPDDLHQYRFRVHSETIPISAENETEDAAPIVQPVLISKHGDGIIYEKRLLDALYQQQRYEQYVLRGDPRDYELNQFSHALYTPRWGVWECMVFRNKKDVQVLALPDGLIQQQSVTRFLLAETQKLLHGDDEFIYATIFPELINAFLIKKSHYATEDNGINQQTQPDHTVYFLPHDQQFVCFACTGPVRSKIDARETIETGRGLVGVFRSENKAHTTLLMVEKKDRNLCGRINVYQFFHTAKTASTAESLVIKKTPIRDEEYAQLTQAELLERYGLTPNQVCARICKVTQSQADKLKTLIKRDQQRVESKTLQYAHRSGKIFIEACAFFVGLLTGGLEYQNEASWCIGLLIQANIPDKDTEFKYDREYSIPRSIPWSTIFFGQTPDRVLPLPKKSAGSTPSRSEA